MKRELIFKESKLNESDKLEQTYGCRHSNPEICSNNGVVGKCAFSSEDCICKIPPRSWKKLYERLKKEEQ